jgi:hypothetical protein
MCVPCARAAGDADFRPALEAILSFRTVRALWVCASAKSLSPEYRRWLSGESDPRLHWVELETLLDMEDKLNYSRRGRRCIADLMADLRGGRGRGPLTLLLDDNGLQSGQVSHLCRELCSLAGAVSVAHLRLYKNPLDDKCMPDIARLIASHPLHELHLSHTGLTTDGVLTLLVAARDCGAGRGGRRYLFLRINDTPAAGSPAALREALLRCTPPIYVRWQDADLRHWNEPSAPEPHAYLHVVNSAETKKRLVMGGAGGGAGAGLGDRDRDWRAR